MEARLNMFVFISLVVAAMLHGSSAQTTHVVGDELGWLVPPGGEVAYQTWAADQTFTVGDVLVFNFTNAQHNVLQVTRAEFDSCNVSTTTTAPTTASPARITITSSGEHYYMCTVPQHCSFGQKLAINVTAASASPAPQPQPATPPPAASPETAPSPVVPASEVYTVGDALGWLVPPGGPIAYQTWARDKTFTIGDVLVFNFTNAQHNVLQVTRAEFDSCNVSTTTTPPTTASPARITLTSAGEHYYMCTVPQHCSLGQKLAINVTGGDASPAPAPSTPAPTPSTPAPTPSSQATPPPSSATPPSTAGGPSSSTPSTPATPSPLTPPPPPSSATSVAAAALPFTFLAVALAFLV